jgi:membrane-associated phospholipid phosphatase
LSTCRSPRKSTASASRPIGLLDRALYIAFRTAGHAPRAERAVKAFSKFGEHGMGWQAIALGGAAFDKRRRRKWLHAWAVIAASFLANQAIKLVVRRPRPDVEGLPPLTQTLSNRSYPSAHATTSAAAMRVLPPLAGPGSAPALASAAAAMSLSRLYLGVHWPSDTVAGFALGAAIAELVS